MGITLQQITFTEKVPQVSAALSDQVMDPLLNSVASQAGESVPQAIINFLPIIKALGITAVLSTLVGFFISILFFKGRQNEDPSNFKHGMAHFITCSAVFISFCAFVGLCYFVIPQLNGGADAGAISGIQIDFFQWLKSEKIRIRWSLNLDFLTLGMALMVTFVSFWVHIYSVGYMAHDVGRSRFMAYLNLFTFMMIMLITAPSLPQMFVGWEGVGLCSYLLIGFWQQKSRPGLAAMKAMIVNRVGDAALVLGMALAFYSTESLSFSGIIQKVPALADQIFFQQEVSLFGLYSFLLKIKTIDLMAVLFLIGAMAKSAQLGLHIWLPDAMEAPTPVSALIHAATMVTAGIFLIVKLSVLFDHSPMVKDLMLAIGALTAIFGALTAIPQTDIKKIIAFSTCSQLGYMMMACGLGAYDAAMFHLYTHAFFKALLFLGAGSVIHAMSGEQNILKMGGLRKQIPGTYYMMWLGTLAITGFPFFSGYYSKDLILSHLWGLDFKNALAIVVILAAFITVAITSFYSIRLLILIFHGKVRGNEQVVAHIHEPPELMMRPLNVLAVGAILSGYIGWEFFIDHSKIHDHAWWMEALPLLMALTGALLAVKRYHAYYGSHRNADKNSPGYLQPFKRIIYNKFYFDEAYAFIFVRPLFKIGRFLFKTVDNKIIDGLGPDGFAKVFLHTSKLHRVVQNGYLSSYAFVMLVAIVIIIGCAFFAFSNVNEILKILIGVKVR